MFIKIKLSLIFVLTFIAPIACAGAACAGGSHKSDMIVTKSSPLRMSIDLDAKKYKSKDDIGLVITLWNESPVDLYIPRKEGFYTDVSVRLKDHSTGMELETAFVPDSLPPPPMSARDLLRIARCSYVKEKINISLRDFNVQGGHRYDLVVEYQSSLPRSMNFGVNIFGSENGAVISSPLVIDIIGN